MPAELTTRMRTCCERDTEGNGVHRFDDDTAAADAALAMAEVGRRVRERYPMIQRLFIESAALALPQRWSRPDAIRTLPDATATP